MGQDDDTKRTDGEIGAAASNPARREALVKIGKYAAYTAPAMMVTVRNAEAGRPAPTSPPPNHLF